MISHLTLLPNLEQWVLQVLPQEVTTTCISGIILTILSWAVSMASKAVEVQSVSTTSRATENFALVGHTGVDVDVHGILLDL